MKTNCVTFLEEEISHAKIIELINEEAFGPGRFSRSAERIREQGSTSMALSRVAKIGDEVVGSVRMTPIVIGDAPGYLLGPLAVRPAHKKLGIGRELVLQVLKLAAKQENAKYVLLVGDEPYYAPLGFSTFYKAHVEMPGPVLAHRVLFHELHGFDACQLNGAVQWAKHGAF